MRAQWGSLSLMLMLFNVGIGTLAYAQAWVQGTDSLTVGLTYQNAKGGPHLFPNHSLDGADVGQARGGPTYPAGKNVVKSKRADMGNTYMHIVSVSADYVPMDNLGIMVGLPFITSKYEGPLPLHGPIDDEKWHSDLQDLFISARYMIDIPQIVVVTPFVSYSRPIGDYGMQGDSAIGTKLQEASLGLFVGRDIGPILPDAYLQGRYGYTWVERPKLLKRGSDRSIWGAELGYRISEILTVHGSVDERIGHQGVVWPNIADPNNPNVYKTHDQLAKISSLTVGAGADYQLTERVGINFAISQMLSGANVMQAKTFSVGATWNTPKAGWVN